MAGSKKPVVLVVGWMDKQESFSLETQIGKYTTLYLRDGTPRKNVFILNVTDKEVVFLNPERGNIKEGINRDRLDRWEEGVQK